jgi:hypothetical protein
LQLGDEFEIVEVLDDYGDDEDKGRSPIDINQTP